MQSSTGCLDLHHPSSCNAEAGDPGWHIEGSCSIFLWQATRKSAAAYAGYAALMWIRIGYSVFSAGSLALSCSPFVFLPAFAYWTSSPLFSITA